LPANSRETACRLQHFVVENAKTARAALKWLGHPLPIQSLAIEQMPEHLNSAEVERLLHPLKNNQDLGVMSEAGCPGVADPGALLVRRAHEWGVVVKPLVGPSSLLLALMASGLNGQHFVFHGYLPNKDPERGKRIALLEKESRQKQQTQLFIEAPYRNQALFDALLTNCQPSTLLCIASDLTLTSESIKTSTIHSWKKTARPNLDRRPTVFLLLSEH
jgi:16S rRNA (cytidine1402-2'-O)-methyltransferase